MYQITYGDALLHDPLTDGRRVTSARLSQSSNAPAYLDVEVPPTHPLASVVRERDRTATVRLWDGQRVEFVGWVESVRTGIGGTLELSCVSVLDALNDTVVRPYSTVAGEQPLTAPSSPAGYFQWLVDQHNASTMGVTFRVGANEADRLDPNGYVYRSSAQRPTTASEMSQKVLQSLGGHLALRYEGDDYVLDLLADVADANAQVIDFGENLLEFAREVATDDIATAIVPVGGTPEGADAPVTLSGTGGTGDADIVHDGDRIWSESAVRRWGWREATWTDSDATTQDGLMGAAVAHLRQVCSPTVTVECKAVDLALIDPDMESLRVGQAVRVRAVPLGVDEWLMVSSVDLDLADPSQSAYTLGRVQSTLTKSLNAGIDRAHDVAAGIGDAAKAKADAAALRVDVESDVGTVFGADGISATLTAHVRRYGVELDADEVAALGTIRWRVGDEIVGEGATYQATGATERMTVVAELVGGE